MRSYVWRGRIESRSDSVAFIFQKGCVRVIRIAEWQNRESKHMTFLAPCDWVRYTP